METFILLWWIFLAAWFFGGIAFFTWIDWNRNVKRAKRAYHLAIEGAKMCGMAALMLAPFSIPIIVTAICLFFGP